jgi:hypothetical protein
MTTEQRSRLAALVLIVAVLVLMMAGVASAAPTVTMQASVSAIPRNLLSPKSATWPHTGGAGEGAELTASFTIQGTEQAGLPAPLRRVVLSLPAHSKIHTSGFAHCHIVPSNWHKLGNAPPCPGRSFAGAATEGMQTANYVGTDVPEPVRQGLFFNASGQLDFWVLGLGQWLNLGGVAPGSLNSHELTETLPRIETPGSVLQPQTTSIAIGAAYRQGRALVSLLTLPKHCPAGGYPITAKLSFGNGSESEWQSVAVTAKAACK